MTRHPAERRRSDRYPADKRLFASIDGQTVVLSDISVSGVAMHANGLGIGGTHVLELNLNRQHLALAVEVVDVTDDDLLHARFIAPGSAEATLINHYIAGLRYSPDEAILAGIAKDLR